MSGGVAMVMPDELDPMPYRGRPYDELVALLLQRDQEIKVWRQRWKEEQQKRLLLQEHLP